MKQVKFEVTFTCNDPKSVMNEITLEAILYNARIEEMGISWDIKQL